VVPYRFSPVLDVTGTITADVEAYTLFEFRRFTSWMVAYIVPEYPIPATPDK
jgi:hypothetical protein